MNKKKVHVFCALNAFLNLVFFNCPMSIFTNPIVIIKEVVFWSTGNLNSPIPLDSVKQYLWGSWPIIYAKKKYAPVLHVCLTYFKYNISIYKNKQKYFLIINIQYAHI